MELKLISWNVQRGGRPAEQLPEILEREPDVIALQEIKAKTVDAWREQLEANGFCVETTVELIGERTHGLLLASKLPMVRLMAQRVEIPFPELLLSAVVRPQEACAVEVHNTHVPNGSSYGYRKAEHFEGLYRYLIRPIDKGRPRILCGDFNGPRGERKDGTVVTWAQTEDGTRLRPALGQRWDAAERSVFQGLAAFGLVDVYRDVHGYTHAEENTEGSWMAPSGHGRRLDHAFADPALKPWSAQYLHEWRSPKALSDHSALELTCSAGRG